MHIPNSDNILKMNELKTCIEQCSIHPDMITINIITTITFNSI
jgi:hypothetical protein